MNDTDTLPRHMLDIILSPHLVEAILQGRQPVEPPASHVRT